MPAPFIISKVVIGLTQLFHKRISKGIKFLVFKKTWYYEIVEKEGCFISEGGTSMTHAHITAWVIALILFFVAASMQKGGKSKSLKMVHMTLRLFYILIIVTGAILLIGLSSITLMYVVKVLAGIWVISMLEMILVRNSKGKSTGMFWGQLVVAFFVTLYLGLKLPIGFMLF